DRDALEEIEMNAERVRDQRLDGIGVRHHHDRLTAMPLDDALDGGHDARLHLHERLAAREAESAGMTLHRVPLRLLAQLVERLPGPVTGVEVGEIAIDPHRASALARDRGRGLARPL